MTDKFKVEFLPNAVDFMDKLDKKSQEKTYYNIRKAQLTNDTELFNQHMLPKKKIKTVSLETMIDKHVGKIGMKKRDAFEQELKLDSLGHAIKQARLHHNLTQEQLGKLVGVQKAQISKLENNFTNARFNTVIKVFNALHAKVNFNVVLPKMKLKVA